ncbi:tRNA lysidine(34) synthetase TilS [Catellatospora bangladeshensis]|uniref:tRNA(Ile)-lysidine synthase n=1 Tax=Catellatospora bangladeshensis TaxID=310355 RepID=A0A8J3JEW9_9ACTN|nr:tRNA lysidine(34) synthetase TilS [Catellatospora bangladeshensis]GIF81359.1 tRNA(Ile)-lysidine synthase [Catellatospora bangladeshensis]
MTRLDPSIAAIRAAIRTLLPTLPEVAARPPMVLVACSGGADSLALAACAAFVAPRLGWRAGLVTVDHGLQEGSAERAGQVASWARTQGFEPVEVATVEVGTAGGPEAAAREARYAALAGAARRHDAAAVLLGHTRDDQAETVLLALARGAGPRGLAGMPTLREHLGARFARPLLDVPRETCRAACAALGLTPWEDPHNTDPSYARARVRADLLPALVTALGEGVVANLARTAGLLAEDTAYLDELAEAALARCRTPDGLSTAELGKLPAALRTRVLHGWAAELGAPRAALSHRHVAALDALVTTWHGQGPTLLPGGIAVARRDGELAAAPG